MTNTQFGEECDIVAVLTPKPGKLDRVCYPSWCLQAFGWYPLSFQFTDLILNVGG